MSTRKVMIEAGARGLSAATGCHGCDLDDDLVCRVCLRDAAAVIDATAAHDLYKALDRMLTFFRESGNDVMFDVPDDVYREADAALAKARGEG